MFFTPKPVSKRVSGGVVCLMLVMLGVALFAGFDLMGAAGFRAPDPGVPAAPARGDGGVRATARADVFVTIGQAALQALTAAITKIVTGWWPTALLDWMQAVHRGWPPIHRLPGTSPPQP